MNDQGKTAIIGVVIALVLLVIISSILVFADSNETGNTTETTVNDSIVSNTTNTYEAVIDNSVIPTTLEISDEVVERPRKIHPIGIEPMPEPILPPSPMDGNSSLLSLNITAPSADGVFLRGAYEITATFAGVANVTIGWQNSSDWGIIDSSYDENTSYVYWFDTISQLDCYRCYSLSINVSQELISEIGYRFNLTIDNTPPTVNLLSTSFNTTNNRPNITFNYTDSLSPLATCRYYVDGATSRTIVGLANNTNTDPGAGIALGDGQHDVWVNCTDEAGNEGTSVHIFITVNATVDPFCGDGLITVGESCDGANWGPIIGCTDFNGFTGGNLTCNSPGSAFECTFNTSLCTEAICGNGALEDPEQCDAGLNNSIPCTPPYGGSCVYCDDVCLNVTLNGLYCGDGIASDGEECDGANGTLGGYTCLPDCTLELSLLTEALLRCPFDNTTTCTDGETPLENNGTDFVSGIDGGAVQILVNDTLSYPYSDNFDINKGTISVWFKPPTTMWDCNMHIFLHHQSPSNNANLRFRIGKYLDSYCDPISYHLAFYNGGDRAAEALLLNGSIDPVNGWYHVATTWNSSTMKVYMNGQLRGTWEESFAIGTPADRIYIGGYPPYEDAYVTDGALDNLNIFGRVLNDSEIEALYFLYGDVNGTYYCGDGAINRPGEECDGMNGTSEHYLCTANCVLEKVLACGDTIYNDTVLTEDLLDCSYDGIIIGADNVTLDCAGHRINGGGGASTGIDVYNWQGTKVQNCIVGNFTFGAHGVSCNALFVNNIFANTQNGIDIYFCDGVTILNNTFRENGRSVQSSNSRALVMSYNTIAESGIGVFAQETQYVLSHNYFNHDTYGVNSYNSGYRTEIFDNTFYNNPQYGLWLGDAENVSVFNNTFLSNPGYGIYLWGYNSNNNIVNNTFIDNWIAAYEGSSVPVTHEVTACDNVTVLSAGEFVLNTDLVQIQSDECLHIASDAILDCRGHTIMGHSGAERVLDIDGTVRNCHIITNGVSSVANLRSGGIFENNIIHSDISDIGLFAYAGTIRNNIFYRGEIYCQGGGGVNITNNTFNGVYDGGGRGAIQLSGDAGDVVSDNIFNLTAYPDCGYTYGDIVEAWYPNTIDANYYIGPCGKASNYSLICADENDDGLCDVPFTFTLNGGLNLTDERPRVWPPRGIIPSTVHANSYLLNKWNSSILGNYWSDFSSNPGYPLVYIIPGPGEGIDYLPAGRDLPPIIQPISDIVVYEGENVTVFVNASDPNNSTESLYYDIIDDDGRFSRILGTYAMYSWTTNYTDSGIYVFTVVVSDGYLNATTTFNLTVLNVLIDDTPPVIFDVKNMSITTSRGTISWSTDEPANTSVNYGTTEALGTYSGFAALTFAHSRRLKNLDQNTTYYYNVTSCDEVGHCNTSGPYTFTTLDASFDGLLLHCAFNDTTTCSEGEVPTHQNGLSYAPGVDGNGVFISGGDQLDYATQGNFLPETGTVSLWIVPFWNGSDDRDFYIFDVYDRYDAEPTWTRFDMRGKTRTNMHYSLYDGSDYAVFYYNVSSWRAGEPHHLVMTWDLSTEIRGYVDGVLFGTHSLNITLPGFSDIMNLGHYKDTNEHQFDGVLDELNIYGRVLNDSEIEALYQEHLSYCGDGVVNQVTEECDAGVDNGVTCGPPYGGSCVYCDVSCLNITLAGPYCGDGVVNDASEQCDGADGTPDYYACLANCTLEYVPYCGDGVVNQMNESCDDTDGVPTHYICLSNCTLQQRPWACGDVINVSGYYTLTNDVNCPVLSVGNAAIAIAADNVTVDCNWFDLAGQNQTGRGIYVFKRGVVLKNVTIRNCRVGGFNRGINLAMTNDSFVENAWVHDNAIGVQLDASGRNEISLTVESNTYQGVLFQAGSNNNHLNNTSINHSKYGVFILSSINNIIEGNWFDQNNFSGIYLKGNAFENTIIDNSFYATGVTDTTGLNNTYCIAGHPNQYYDGATGPVCPLFCGDTIYVDTVLKEDLLDCAGDGIVIGADNVTLDCAGHVIDGTGTWQSTGIYSYSRTDLTVQNCLVKEFYNGSSIIYSGDVFFFNNTFSHDVNGIGIWASDGVLISNNLFYNNSFGLSFLGSNDNSVVNNWYCLN